MVVESLQSLYKKSIYIFIINIKEKLIKLEYRSITYAMIQPIFKPYIWTEVRKGKWAGETGNYFMGMNLWKNASHFELVIALVLSVKNFF